MQFKNVRYKKCCYCCNLLAEFTHDVTCAVFVFQKKETAAILVSQTSTVGFEFSLEFVM